MNLIDMLKDQIAKLKTENNLLDKINPANDKIANAAKQVLSLIDEHFDGDWNIKGPGEWRIRAIAGALKMLKETVDAAEEPVSEAVDDFQDAFVATPSYNDLFNEVVRLKEKYESS